MHQKAGGEQVEKGLLQKYRQDIQTGGMVSSPSATQALGVNVDGYVMPMFLSQTAIAWNRDLVTTPPASYDELVAWTQKHPQAFGYNGIKNGMSGVSFCGGLDLRLRDRRPASLRWAPMIKASKKAGSRPMRS